jgi:thymidylate synthase (FAD)
MLNETATGETLDPDRSGLARELARMNLSVNFYTQWYWKIDLHNLLHFLKLRGDPHAQYEIRAYADAMLDIVKQWVPLTYAAFMDYRLGAYELSAKGLAAVRRLLRGGQRLLGAFCESVQSHGVLNTPARLPLTLRRACHGTRQR